MSSYYVQNCRDRIRSHQTTERIQSQSQKGGQRRRQGDEYSACPSFRLEVEKNLTAPNDEATSLATLLSTIFAIFCLHIAL